VLRCLDSGHTDCGRCRGSWADLDRPWKLSSSRSRPQSRRYSGYAAGGVRDTESGRHGRFEHCPAIGVTVSGSLGTSDSHGQDPSRPPGRVPGRVSPPGPGGCYGPGLAGQGESVSD
jgi:hypothetical protein